MRQLLTLAGLLAGAVGTLAAQGADLSRLNGRVPPVAARAVAAQVDSATRAGLPPGPLVRKALEGGSKGVPADRIIAAVRVVREQLAEASSAIRASGAAADAEAIEAGGYAINAGLSPAQVTELGRPGQAPEALSGSLRSAGTLVALGVPAPQAVALVEEWVLAGKPTSQVLQLPELLQAAMARGATPAQAAAGMAHGNPGGPGGPPSERPGPPPQSQGQGQGQGHPRRP